MLIALEVAAVLSADLRERSEDWLDYRNAFRPRVHTTHVSNFDLGILKLRSGGFLPSILDPKGRNPRR
jgi:transposase-like protein